MRALEEFHRDRYGRIREGLYKLFEGFNEDQVLETMKDDPETAHFALKRMVEIVDQQWAAERELQIEKLLNEITILNQGHELRLTQETRRREMLESENGALKTEVEAL